MSIYSASLGQRALDRLGPADRHPNSVFTRVFVEKLKIPGLDLRAVTVQTRIEVHRIAGTVGHEQVVAYYENLLHGEVCLAGRPPREPPRPEPPVPPGPDGSFSPARADRSLSRDELRTLRPRDAFRECESCPEMVIVPAGSFMMGSPPGEPRRSDDEGPQRRVTFAHQFSVGRFPVTVDQFRAFVNDTRHVPAANCWTRAGRETVRQARESWTDPGFRQAGRNPVVCISWSDANAYAAWLSQKAGSTYRLLSEAEREYTARADTSTAFWTGNSITTSQANYDGSDSYNGSPRGPFRQATTPVDSFAPNTWGLHDVHGNVWEWTLDCWNDSYRGAPTDGSARRDGDCARRVLRGGSWRNSPWNTRSAVRLAGSAALSLDGFGFRVARALGYVVQIGSYRSESSATEALEQVKSRYPSIVGHREPKVVRADLGEPGTYFRVVADFELLSGATEYCNQLRAAGGDCVVRQR
jgi:formylglycine-generating enzyme required for sulfatase activity